MVYIKQFNQSGEYVDIDQREMVKNKNWEYEIDIFLADNRFSRSTIFEACLTDKFTFFIYEAVTKANKYRYISYESTVCTEQLIFLESIECLIPYLKQIAAVQQIKFSKI